MSLNIQKPREQNENYHGTLQVSGVEYKESLETFCFHTQRLCLQALTDFRHIKLFFYAFHIIT